MRGILIALCVLAVGCATVQPNTKQNATQTEITMPSLFADHMVVQQKMPIKVWGKTAPNTKVRVSLGPDAAIAKSTDNGHFLVDLAPLKAGGPYTLEIKAGKSIAHITDVLVGEVWVCSGQSNMEFSMAGLKNPEEEYKKVNNPQIRMFTVQKKVSAEPLDGCVGSWALSTPDNAKSFSAVGYFFARRLNEVLKVPVGMIHTSWGGTPAESWTTRATLEADPDLDVMVKHWDDMLAKYPEAKKQYDAALAEWKKTADDAKAKGQPEPKKPEGAPAGPDNPNRTSGLYNGMIAPLIPYTIGGAIWYQGESNAGRAYQYRKLFPAMIQDWRKNWGEGSFPFFFVQLANFMDREPNANAPSAWAELREAQSKTLSLDKTGMAVIIDIGDAKDIHPKDKQRVGERLAQAAFKTAYGIDCVFSGPEYKSMRVDGNKVHLKFDHADQGLKALDGGAVKGFAIAGADQKFVWGDATIAGDEVIVSSSAIAQPTAVRYGWANNPDCNLYNGAGLPASPFRTDDFPGVTINNK